MLHFIGRMVAPLKGVVNRIFSSFASFNPPRAMLHFADIRLPLSQFMWFVATVLFFVSRVYYFYVNLFFDILRFFSRRRYVQSTNCELLLISATQAAKAIREKLITSEELIEAYISRIEEVNPVINAIAQTNFSHARKKAAEVDAEVLRADEYALKEIESKRPLLGVPFTVKDCIEVDGLKCTVGLKHREDQVSDKNAEVIDRMLAAGAIVIAVTNVPEMCVWTETNNKLYGRTSNPYDNRRTAGGSSGGEAALMAAAGSLIGIGSDLAGSIRAPAFWNGVFGLKPTPGVVSLEGHQPPAVGYRKSMLRIGPICRYANDLSLMYKVMAGEDVAKELRIDEPTKMTQLRIFYMEGLTTPFCESTSYQMSKALRRAVRYLELKYGLTTVRVDFPLAHRVLEFFLTSATIPGEKFSEMLTPDTMVGKNCFWELIRWTLGQSHHTLPAIILGLFDSLPTMTDSYRDTLLFTPGNLSYTCLFNVLAFPVVQCPVGFAPNGLPLGVQVVGAPKSDRNLIAIAKDFEEGFGGWQQPLC